VSESIETIEREFAMSQKRSEERRSYSPRWTWKDRAAMFFYILAILVFMGAVIFGILIATKAIKM